jgi:ribonuclease BN (tRNA processing enzyme)
MPDFIGLSNTLPPFVAVLPVVPDRPFALGRYTVTPIPLRHTIPTVGYVVDDGMHAVAILTDTAPVPEVFKRIAVMPRLALVFLECSFPRRMAELAGVSKHQTTDHFATAARLFPRGVTVVPIHIKPRYWDEVTAELKELGFQVSRGGCLFGTVHGEDEIGEMAEWTD